ncbi:MAG: hypothetical protein HPY45_15535 [Anaerolineae bacterium]|nr:hypothetical protein [Anaerolineae bacterium]
MPDHVGRMGLAPSGLVCPIGNGGVNPALRPAGRMGLAPSELACPIACPRRENSGTMGKKGHALHPPRRQKD